MPMTLRLARYRRRQTQLRATRRAGLQDGVHQRAGFSMRRVMMILNWWQWCAHLKPRGA